MCSENTKKRQCASIGSLIQCDGHPFSTLLHVSSKESHKLPKQLSTGPFQFFPLVKYAAYF